MAVTINKNWERKNRRMAKLVAFYSRADENYFGGQHHYIKVGNTEKAAKMIAQITGACESAHKSECL